jgi:dipeptidyl aminopeptidase B
MPTHENRDEEETLLPAGARSSSPARDSLDTVSSGSTTSLVLDRLNDFALDRNDGDRLPPLAGESPGEKEEDEVDVEGGYPYSPTTGKPMEKKARRYMCILAFVFIGGWLMALALFLSRQAYKHSSTIPHDPQATQSRGSGKKITLDQVLYGGWRERTHGISWIEGAYGEDGLLLEVGAGGIGSTEAYAVVQDVRSSSGNNTLASATLMKDRQFKVGNDDVYSHSIYPSRNLRSVLVVSDKQSVSEPRDW